jgi:phage terminase large subunit
MFEKNFNIIMGLNNTGKTTLLRDLSDDFKNQLGYKVYWILNYVSKDMKNISELSINITNEKNNKYDIKSINILKEIAERGNIDYLFIDECNELSREDYFQLFIRTRIKTIIAYNPSFGTNNYIFNEIQTHPESDLHISTFRDNPFLEQNIIDEIERLKYTNPEYYKIYGLGLPGNNVGTIFSITLIDEIPEDSDFIAFGMDYGYSIDPTTLVTVSKKDNNHYIDELLYKTNMVTGDIINYLKGLDLGRNEIYADSAEGRLIEEIYRAGFNIKPVKKGKDSIKMGIDIMHQHILHILKSSVNIVREFFPISFSNNTF